MRNVFNSISKFIKRFTGRMPKKKTPCSYDPSWVVNLAESQMPEDAELINELKKCTKVVAYCGCGCGDPYFVRPHSEDWVFDHNVVLEREDGTDVILDVMKNGRIGGIEIGEWDKKH
ncbi:MAG: hypothetical protein A4E71_00524 [Smithella sp. PtaU1.Bin162]|nr:MAG: hypothetical protein A4E71_00524 [Smithella sp. PtaU1.Bin162]